MKAVLAELHVGGQWAPYAGATLKASALQNPLVRERVSIRLETAFVRESADTLAERFLEQGVGVVGFSCYLWNIRKVLATCRRLKELDPRVRIVLGGPEASPVARKVLAENPFVDVVVHEDGEVTFTELLCHYVSGTGGMEDILGIAYRREEGVFQNQARPLPDVALLASPYRSGLPELDGHFQWAIVENSRGCPFRCKFCDYQTNQRVRWFPLERVIKELEFLAPRAANIHLCDSDTFLDRVRARELLRVFSRLSRQYPVALHITTNPIFLDEESMALLNSSQIFIGAGVQSIDDEALEEITRPHNQRKADIKMDLFNALAPRARVNIYMIYGLPGDNLEKFRDSVDWEMSKRPDWPGGSHTLVLPGADMGQHPEKYGLVFEQTPPYRILSNPTWTWPDILEASRIVNYVRAFSADPYIQETLYALGEIWKGRERRPFLSAFRGFYEFLCDAGVEAFVRLKRARFLDDPSSPNTDGTWNVMAPVKWPSLFDENPSDELLLKLREYVERRLKAAGAGQKTAELVSPIARGIRRNDILRRGKDQESLLKAAADAAPEAFGPGNRVLLLGSGAARLADALRKRDVLVTAVEWEKCSYVDAPSVAAAGVFTRDIDELLGMPWGQEGFDGVVVGLMATLAGEDAPSLRLWEWLERQLKPDGRLLLLGGEGRPLENLTLPVPREWRERWRRDASVSLPGRDGCIMRAHVLSKGPVPAGPAIRVSLR